MHKILLNDNFIYDYMINKIILSYRTKVSIKLKTQRNVRFMNKILKFKKIKKIWSNNSTIIGFIKIKYTKKLI